MKLIVLKNLNAELYNTVMDKTSFLNSNSNLQKRLLFIKENYSKLPLCKMCNIEHEHILSDKSAVSEYCSIGCYYKDSNRIKNNFKNVNQQTKMEKLRATNKIKYGYEYNSQRPEIKPILAATQQKHYSSDTTQKLENKDWLIEQYVTNKKTSVEIGIQLGVYYGTVLDYLRKYDVKILPFTNRSAVEREIQQYIETLNINFICSDKNIIAPYELDFYFPDHNFAIELNGIYWHSHNYIDAKIRNKHLLKTTSCKAKNTVYYILLIFNGISNNRWLNL